MLNDRSSPLSLLKTRRSAKPRDMHGDGPDEQELQEILEIAARVPDHGALTPWRFVLVGSEERDSFARLLRDSLQAEQPSAGPAHYAKEEQFAHYAGTLVVLISAPVADHKIPVWEQHLSCGAVAMNLLNAATTLGYVAGWVTGWRAYSPAVTSAFCRHGERIAGFIFIAKSAAHMDERPRPELGNLVRTWQVTG